MSDEVIRLRQIFDNQIKWYKEKMKTEGESYVYDECFEQFNDLRRADCMEILEILSDEKKEG